MFTLFQVFVVLFQCFAFALVAAVLAGLFLVLALSGVSLRVLANRLRRRPYSGTPLARIA